VSNIQWQVAEVLGYDYTYQYVPPSNSNAGNTDQLFALRVSTLVDFLKRDVLLARPSNMASKQIPLIGEIVLIYKTINEHTTDLAYREGWYYLVGVDLQSSINENRLPGVSQTLSAEKVEQIPAGLTFKTKSISPLQPYEGDTIHEGRWGQSIRLGSSISTYPTSGFEKPQTSNGYYHKPAAWSTANQSDGDPIIIISNGRKNLPKKEFVVENIEQDAASLYLTSTQQLNDLKITKPLTVHNSFDGSQFVGIADRIILRAKRDLAVIDSELGIVLNTPNNIYIGGEKASQPLVHGDVLMEILSKILDHLQFVPIQCGELTGGFLSKTQLASARRKLDDLVSSKYRMEFNPRK
jgi:hypothetical protein